MFLIIFDIVAIHTAYFVSLWMRFDMIYSAIKISYLRCYARTITPYALCCVVVFYIFRMYRSMLRYAGVYELLRTFLVSFGMSCLYAVSIRYLVHAMPRLYYFMGAMAQFALLVAGRFSFRFADYIENLRRRSAVADRVMIVGAGVTGQMILQDMNRSARDRAVCFIDDNPQLWNRFIEGVPIVGGRDEILGMAGRYHVDKIYLAMPGASATDRRDIINICNETSCEIKQVPSMYQSVDGTVSVSDMRNISVEDLLGRAPIKADMQEVFAFINGRTVLVTGGGGSIGSELCRQIAAHHPKQLIIFDVYENSTYNVQLELKEKYPDLNLEVLIGSVRDSRRVFQVFKTYRPQIVYHAAAHKHVPLMEDSPCEAIKNNAIGTYKTAYAAMAYGCARFVLISTDKAVNPTNIMGASKRLCEMIIQGFNEKLQEGRAADIPRLFTHEGGAMENLSAEALQNARTEFVAVRFGNVLGSNGSVIPIFKRQIEAGGPVTVTHPDIIRYFMTIPEAVSLVMLAGTYASGGEIFVLDMGSPVKIADLARNLIRLSGYKPDVDIKIEYTGLRPGEKLYEEKLMTEEGLRRTENDLIHIGTPIQFDVNRFFGDLERLMMSAYDNEADIRDQVEAIVKSYHPIPPAFNHPQS